MHGQPGTSGSSTCWFCLFPIWALLGGWAPENKPAAVAGLIQSEALA